MANIQRTNAPAKAKADSVKTNASAPATRTTPSVDAVAARAYQLWRESGCAHGNDQTHWFRAEQELRARATLR